ncbi:MAG: hypothetical protein PHC34_12610 [Candidatus Gastranaerophilales bacterium]|nr:hypothetical protein [Candidatus Gastranaerophilales bacterium]
MEKSKNSVWAQEVNYDELHSEKYDIQNSMLADAYEALNRFYKKDQRRSKFQKRSKDCWQ